jgi:phosphohistidine phosphatase
MLHLILLRHAKSSWTQNGQLDFDRSLNERGQKDLGEMARRMRARGLQPRRIVSSSAARTRETAEAMARYLDLPGDGLVFERRLYLAEPADMMSVLREQPSSITRVMLVGHNPGITDFANRLADGYVDNMPTCSFAEISFDETSWSEIDWDEGKLVHFDWPKSNSADIDED